MKHQKLTDPLREQAALYALGALSPDERRSYAAHLDAGCAVCRTEVDSFGSVTGNLALASTPVAPRSQVRSRLLIAARASTPTAQRSPFRFVMGREGDWTELEPGVFRKDLLATPGSSAVSYLIRIQPGRSVSSHDHHAVEHCYVIEGDLHIAGRHIHAGDFTMADRGSTHTHAWSDHGCVLLIVEGRA